MTAMGLVFGMLAALVAATTIPSGGVKSGEEANYDRMLTEQARSADATYSGAACEDSKVEVTSITPWKITDSPDLIVWREKVRVAGCGRSSVENLNIGRLGGSPPWRMTSGLPGDSIAEMNLQRSALPAAVNQARAGFPADCKVQISDVYVAGRPGNVNVVPPGGQPQTPRKGHPSFVLPDGIVPDLASSNLAGAWFEVWPIHVCDHDRTLGILFIPRKDNSASLYEFIPIWERTEAHGPGALPAPDPPRD